MANAIIKPISKEEVAKAQIEGNLPDKPSQATLYGGKVLTPQEIKAWYDKLPKLIVDYYNNLIKAIPGIEEGKISDNSLAAQILTGIREGHSLKNLLEDITSGAFSQYLKITEEKTLYELYKNITSEVLRKSLMDVEDGDANNISDNGYYFYGSSDAVKNVPESAGVIIACLDHLDSPKYRSYQLALSYTNNMYRRNRQGDSWTKWIKLATISDLPDVPENMLTLRNELTTENLNEVVESGYYFAGNDATVSNYPKGESGRGFMLLVINGGSSSRRYQIYFSYDSMRMYHRRQTYLIAGNEWSEWNKIAHTSEFPTNLLAFRSKLTNEDLNKIKNSGYYFAGNDAEISNFPTEENGKGFMLLDFYGNELSKNYQIYFSYKTERVYWRRQEYAVGEPIWSKWNKIAYTTDISNNEKPVFIQKNATGSFIIGFGKYSCKFIRLNNSERNADLYDLYDIFCGDTRITNGNIMGVLKESGQSDFMGGIDHGDEKDYTLSIRCDDSEYNTAVGDLTRCNKIEINYTSKLYRVSDKTHIYNKVVRINITLDKIVIYNDCECVVNDSVLENAYNGGMIDCQFPALIGAVMNNLYAFPAPTTHPNNNSHDNINSVLYWTGGAIRINNITGHQRETYKGSLIAYRNQDGTPQRNKIYYDIVGATATPIANGEHIVGEYELVFN